MILHSVILNVLGPYEIIPIRKKSDWWVIRRLRRCILLDHSTKNRLTTFLEDLGLSEKCPKHAQIPAKFSTFLDVFAYLVSAFIRSGPGKPNQKKVSS